MNDRKVRWVSPVAPRDTSEPATANARNAMRGAAIRLGSLDNAKSNADHLLRMLVERMQADSVIASTHRRKLGPAQPADAQVIEELVANSDFVISAMAD